MRFDIRGFVYRAGRALYMKARGDVPNSIPRNGEQFLQRCLVSAWRLRTNTSRLRVFDVGANVGDWSVSLMSLLDDSEAARVDLHAFEPTPSTFATLSRRLAAFRPFVRCEELALTSDVGQRTLFSKGANAGTNSLSADPAVPDTERVIVRTSTVVDYCRQHVINHVDLLKCDTEGHDMEVILGAAAMLTSGQISVLQFEYNHRWVFARHFLRDVFLAVAGLPYVIAKLQSDRLLLLDAWHPELERFFEGNYVIVHTSAVQDFPTKHVRWSRSNSMLLDDPSVSRRKPPA